MTFLVIGSNSFSGSHFVAWLLEQGERVIGVSRSPQPVDAFLPYRWRGDASAFSFVQADLNHDLDLIQATLQEHRPQVVVNFAAQSMVAQSWEHPEHWYTTNLVSTARLHDLLRDCAFLERYVHVSTPEVYGSCSGLVTEDAPLNPSTPYAVSRAACDMSLFAYHGRYDFPVVFTRAANVYGPGQQLYRIIPRTVLAVLLETPLSLHGGGKAVRSFIHIRDVVQATYRLALEGRAGEVYHLSTPTHVTIRALVEEICDQLEADFNAHVEVGPERPGADAAYLLDTKKIESELDWRPRIELEQGVAETIAWVKRHLDVLREQPLSYAHKA